VTGTFKEKGKIFTVPMPTNPEGLRARIRTLGICFHFLRLRAPGRPELATADVAVLNRYVDWLCGPDVWGHATEDLYGRPLATPTIDHVINYDMQVRKRVAELMNEGTDLKKAFELATSDDRIMQRHFLNHVAIDIGSAKCRACTAPGIAEAHTALAGPPSQEVPTQQKRNRDNSEPGLSKSQLDRIKKKAKQEATAAAQKQLGIQLSIQNGPPAGYPRLPGQGLSGQAKKRAKKAAAAGAAQPLALQNGGVGDSAGKGGKGKGKGKGNGACYAWNDGKPCTNTPCGFSHICSRCGGNHKRGDPSCTSPQ
jgi:hypothetical protein